ncbi:MAG: protoheme IX farnesyltransferase [Sphingobacteriales bacterium]|jgi:protoheme IX farnesyltransferase
MGDRLRDYMMLFKARLGFLVVLSSVLGYWMASPVVLNSTLLWLSVGGFLVTGASNIINQIWERKYDLLMARTAKRPLPGERLSVLECTILGAVSGVLGLILLYVFVNPYCAWLSLAAMISYGFIYTPMKRISPLAVFVGAFPGAIPPLLGYIAHTGDFSLEAGVLFLVQFVWQFPHFWAIAWVADDDYKAGGFQLLPSPGRRDRKSAFQIFMYCLLMIPIGAVPWVYGMTGVASFIGAAILGGIFSYFGFKLYMDKTVSAAKKVMFFSFAHLPLLQIIYVIDKI